MRIGICGEVGFYNLNGPINLGSPGSPRSPPWTILLSNTPRVGCDHNKILQTKRCRFCHAHVKIVFYLNYSATREIKYLRTGSRRPTAMSLSLDVAVLPWSRRGSFMSLTSKVKLGDSLAPAHNVYLVSQCRAPALPLFALRPLPSGSSLGPPAGFHTAPPLTTVSATVPLLQWKYRDKVVAEATFPDVRCIRFRGNTPLAFDSDVAVDMSDYMGPYVFSRPSFQGSKPAVEVTFRTFKGYRFIATKGQLSTVNGDSNKRRLNRRVQIQGQDGDNEWELLLCELEVASARSAPAVDFCGSLVRSVMFSSFEAAVDKIIQEFDEFTLGICPWSAGLPTQSESLASYVIWTSMVRADSNYTREAVMMSKLWMNKVWSWDNCFNALGLAPFNLDSAINQIQILYDYQAPDGRLPDSVDWQNIEWAFTKPPIQGWAISKLLKRHPEINDHALLELYTATSKFTDYWMQQRRTEKSGLPWYSHGNDSGWDNSTAFDSQPVVISPDCAAYLILQTDFLAELASRLMLDIEHQDKWKRMKKTVTEALLSELWDGESFIIKNALTGETRKSTSLLRLMPLVAAKYLPSAIVDSMAMDLSRHLTSWGLSTEEYESPLYEDDGYWRGPIWAPPTLLIESGLRAAGKVELADKISDRFIALCEKSGFAENYDAIKGEGLRDLSYTWTASVFLVLRREASERKYTKEN